MTMLRPPTFVDVLVPVALDHTYSYRVPGELELKPGDIVAVPLGAREVIGVVWADDVSIRPGLHNRMKDVGLKLDYPPVKPELRKFVDWVSEYTLSPRGMVLRMALHMGELGPERERVAVRLAGPAPQRLKRIAAPALPILHTAGLFALHSKWADCVRSRQPELDDGALRIARIRPKYMLYNSKTSSAALARSLN